jgi:uncharacterized oxidoreductase
MKETSMRFTGHTILITGGSAGIGLAFAAKFLELGNEVVVTGRRPSALEAARARYPRLHTITGDVRDPNSVMLLAAEVKERFPKLDVLMNNAGIMVQRSLRVSAASLEDLTAEMDTNVNGTIRTISALIDLLTANRGTIINVSSALAFVPLPSAPIYCATKAAIHSFTTSLRFQLEGSGVRVVELMPPAVKTDMTRDVPEGQMKLITTDELVAATIPALEAGRTEIRPGQSNQLHWLSRLAPGFINRLLYKTSKALIPEA